ncbi:FAD-dependent oxidoreductase [Mesorhizobium sp. WSM2561]|uniref:FAD-dependent oxidoreductase n=1 Tax=Mesorhizobium sp. WSM2561 TaxID=1040985 RepID=UPI0032AF7391
MAKLAQYSAELFPDLEQLTGQPTGFRQSGSITVAATAARMEELKRDSSMGRSFGLAGFSDWDRVKTRLQIACDGRCSSVAAMRPLVVGGVIRRRSPSSAA